MPDYPTYIVVAAGALLIGACLGAIVYHSRFCTMAAIAEAVVVREFSHLRAWILAIVVAMVGTQVLASIQPLDLSSSIYLSSQVFWLGPVAGGLLFGFGMVKASGCGLRNLVNAGSGDLRAVVAVSSMGVFAYMTLRGFLAPVQLQLREIGTSELTESIPTQSVLDIAAHYTGMSSDSVHLLLVPLIAVTLAFYCFSDRTFLSQPRYWLAGLTIGLLVAAGWWTTGVIGFDEFEPTPLASVSMVAPVANAHMYLMTYTGATINFGIALVFGVILGAALIAIVKGEFALVGFTNRQETARYLGGGAMMGIGGVLAGGCTIGQGVTGVATLALGSLIALTFIVLGAVIAIHFREKNKFVDELTPRLIPEAAPGTMYTTSASDFNACGN